MSGSRRQWSRLCRVRQIEEDRARLAVEAAVAALRRAEAAEESLRAAEKEARRRRNAALGDGSMGGADSMDAAWIEPEAEARLLRSEAELRALQIPRIEAALEPARAAYLERRRERQKMESLLAAAAREETLEERRRSQAETEDLFQGRRRHLETRRALDDA